MKLHSSNFSSRRVDKAEMGMPQKSASSRRRLRLVMPLLAVAFVLSAVVSRGQTNSPGGSWDCVISGKWNGLASLIFAVNETGSGGTISGTEIIVPKLPGTHAQLVQT